MSTRLRDKIKGFRTFVVAGVLGVPSAIAGILSAIGYVDLSPLIALFIKNPAYLPAIMALVAIFFAIMRSISPGAGGHDDDGYQFGGQRLKTDQGE